MRKSILTATVSALTLVLAACGSNEQPAQNQPAVQPTNEVADPNNPFVQAEMQMNERMMAAVGTDAEDSWAKKMIEHHQGAIDIARIVLERNPPADVATMARETIDKQQKDVEGIRKLIKGGSPNVQSAEIYRPAMMDMHQKMMAAKGADVSETFMRKMLEHHKGAISMSDVALQNGVSGALRTQVQKTSEENQKEVAMVEAMLRGESHHEAMAASAAKSSAQAKAKAAPADKATGRSAPKTTSAAAFKPATKSAPAPADPHAGHVMNNSQ